jgi:hypothetical protein
MMIGYVGAGIGSCGRYGYGYIDVEVDGDVDDSDGTALSLYDGIGEVGTLDVGGRMPNAVLDLDWRWRIVEVLKSLSPT